MFNLFNFITKVRSSLTREDLKMSRYFCLYDFHSKKHFKIQLEEVTLQRTNELINLKFSKRVNRNLKKEITDCVVIFLKFMCSISKHWNECEFEIHFDRIIRKNLDKIIQGDF